METWKKTQLCCFGKMIFVFFLLINSSHFFLLLLSRKRVDSGVSQKTLYLFIYLFIYMTTVVVHQKGKVEAKWCIFSEWRKKVTDESPLFFLQIEIRPSPK